MNLSRFKEILNNNFQKAYDVSNIVKTIQKYVYVSLPQISKAKSALNLSTLSVEEWSSTVEKGRIQFGKLESQESTRELQDYIILFLSMHYWI